MAIGFSTQKYGLDQFFVTLKDSCKIPNNSNNVMSVEDRNKRFLIFGLTDCAIFIIFLKSKIESYGRSLLQVDEGAGKFVTTHEYRVETI
ncbi:MAG: hypothetical protein ILNGONEN_02435 [Syntrophorhabdaceae bacterium]|nr:hypothetical protein [Syntrophorhabdaceae bacterium]